MKFISDGSVSIKYIPNKYNSHHMGYKEIWINGKNTNCLIEEYCLNACVKINSFYILFTSEDIMQSKPWSETSSWRDIVTYYGYFKATIYLFNDKGEMLDQTSIKSLDLSEYTSSNSYDDDEGPLGSHLIDFKLLPPDTISFLFGGTIWILKLLKEPVPCSHELIKKGRGLLYRPYYPHGILKRFFSFLTRRRLTSLPKHLFQTYLDLNVWIIK